MPFSCSCASAVVYYYFQGFSAGHKGIISYSHTWQKYFILPLFQRWTQLKVMVTWFIIIRTGDSELIAFDGASCNAAYETKYKLTENVFDEVKILLCDSIMCSLNHRQNRWYKHFDSKSTKENHRTTLNWNWKWEPSPVWEKNPRVNSEVLFFVLNGILQVFLDS